MKVTPEQLEKALEASRKEWEKWWPNNEWWRNPMDAVPPMVAAAIASLPEPQDAVAVDGDVVAAMLKAFYQDLRNNGEKNVCTP